MEIIKSEILSLKENQRLSVVQATGSLFLYYFDLETSKVLWSRRIDVGESEQLLSFMRRQLDPARIYYFDDHQHYTLLPDAMYTYGSEVSFFSNTQSSTCTDWTTDLSVVVVYESNTIDEEPGRDYKFHLATNLINYALGEGDILFLYFLENAFYSTLIVHGKLIHHARVTYESVQAAANYVEQVLDTYRADGLELLMGGMVLPESKLVNRLRKINLNFHVYDHDLLINQSFNF